ncbi:ATP-binding protein [Alkaliphilus pronyensis]|uniref:ATP-binding protein n=1 Tax=Alkaliphilus pronyensis TaxID=1482732 RepID=A0A6I0F235_9FIRM|nr:anti-phage-associated helicase HerA [Alkaliphilus pronyensis]KAB3531056.1 ATP-binding protein [Alkaliphilus pronyensis]
MEELQKMNAEVISVFPNKIRIVVDNLEEFKLEDESLKVGSYLRVADNENSILIAIIENFSIEVSDAGKRDYIIEATPLGLIRDGEFVRGGDTIAIPPKKVEPASKSDIEKIYNDSITLSEQFIFSTLSSNREIKIPVNGNKFFNKHISIIGSTGSGKSHTVASIIQKAVNSKAGEYSLNNSHVIIFDIHSEYKAAFPNANIINIDNLTLPYWLLNSEELEEILLDTGERDDYNQSSVFRTLVTANKKKYNQTYEKIFYDTPVFFDINEIVNAIINYKNETENAKCAGRYMINDGTYSLTDGKTTEQSGIKLTNEERINKYFEKELTFYPTKGQNVTKGDYADGTLDKFSIRFQSKVIDKRLEFLFGDKSKTITFEETLQKLMGYCGEEPNNVTVIDLSGIPFEVLSITVSLISRMIFEYGYYYKRLRCRENPDEKINNDVPILLVYEEAHKYVPRSELTKYRSSQKAIERIAKEGRKYGITLLLASQRPSEISETIFSQCNNFIAMRLTNPNDQGYVKKLLPDTLGNLIDKMPSLSAGEALLIGEAIILPSIVQIEKSSLPPSSNDIPYWDLWKEEWKNLDLTEIKAEWYK